MVSQRAALTPQMLQYDEFDDRAETRWQPYLVYFHRTDYRSDVINTDQYGFRISHGAGAQGSPGRLPGAGPVRLLTGSSTAMGIGATSDATTLASRLWTTHAPSLPWLNIAGRSHNSTQELLLFVLYRHLMPDLDRVVFLTGLNDIALARLPKWQRGDHGGFYNCGEYFEAMDELRAKHRKGSSGLLRGRRAAAPERPEEPVPPLAERIEWAVELTARHLDTWRQLVGPRTRITYVLQPLATWMRAKHAPQEDLIFAELDERSNFWELYGDIATMEAGRTYAEALRAACDKLDVEFFDINPVLAEVVGPQDWLYVDRAHFTDHGNDVVGRVLAEHLGLS